MRRSLTLLGALALAAALCALAASPAFAAFGFKEVDLSVADPEGLQAGSHPDDFTATLRMNTAVQEGVGEIPDGEAKDLIVGQIPGLAGNPTATPRCSAADFNTLIGAQTACPDSTVVGLAALEIEFGAFPPGEVGSFFVPVYNLVPPPGVAARLGFIGRTVPVTIDIGVNEDPPYNIVARIKNVPQAILFYGSEFTIWGDPSSPEHDPYRGQCLETEVTSEEPISIGSCPVEDLDSPFLTLPRACNGPLPTNFSAASYQDPGVFTEATALTHNETAPTVPQGMTGCTKLLLGFSPEIGSQPTTSAADSASGLEFSIDIEDEGLMTPDGTAESDIKKIEAILPEGVTANPSAATGLEVCTKAEYEAARLTTAGCPEAAKLGSVEVETPILENRTLHGDVFLAEQDDPATAQPGAENPFDSLLALYLTIREPDLGIFVKQAVKVEPDPQTGQLVTTVDDMPQFPLSHIRMQLRQGPRAPLVTPSACGTYTTVAKLTPWANPDSPITKTSTFKITSGPDGGPCPSAGASPFDPGFEAGSTNNNAGAYSPFYMRLTRRDGEQDMTRFDSILPPGVTGKIAGIPQCSDAQIAAAAAKTGRQELASPSCPESSQIGRVVGGAGVGTSLTYVPGKVYLAGPFAGKPLSVVVITPAVAGPFDVGTVVVREALDLDPTTAEVRVDGAASDPIPHILKGIPLKLRDLRVYVDRQDFILNPTSCDPLSVRATLFGSSADVFSPADDFPVALSERYQAADCLNLDFDPKLKLTLKGGTKRSANTALRAVYTPRTGDANLKGALITLPPSQFIDNAHINNPCTRAQFGAGACPSSSVLGRARAFTPLLDAPLEGTVYFRSNGGERDLPDVVAALRGQFDFNLVIAILTANNGRVRSKVLNAPDAPVSKVVLRMAGGKKSLLENSENLCAKKQRARLVLSGQNGAVRRSTPVVKTDCDKKKKGNGKQRRSPRRAR